MVRVDLHVDTKRDERDERCDDELLVAARREEGRQAHDSHLALSEGVGMSGGGLLQSDA